MKTPPLSRWSAPALVAFAFSLAAPRAHAADEARPTVYTVAQLCSLWGEAKRNAPGTPAEQLQAAAERLKALGLIAVEGQLDPDRRGQTLYYEDETFSGQKVVYLETDQPLPLPTTAGVRVVVVGQIVKVGTWFELKTLGVVKDASRWPRSTQAMNPAGLRRKEVPVAKLQVEPGRGVAPDAIDGVCLHLTWNFTGVGGSLAASYETYLLLKDGWAYQRPSIAPTCFNAALSREREPQRWGHWRRVGENIEIAWLEPGDRAPVAVLKKPSPAFNAGIGARLSGAWRSLGGGGNAALGGGTSIAVSRDYTFTPQGRFARQGVTGVTTGQPGAAPDVVGVSHAGNRGGTYELADWGILLRYDDGETQPLALALMAKDDPSAVVLGQSNFTGQCQLVRR